jgi:hypothetical protein
MVMAAVNVTFRRFSTTDVVSRSLELVRCAAGGLSTVVPLWAAPRRTVDCA